jgi:hypothetical protein
MPSTNPAPLMITATEALHALNKESGRDRPKFIPNMEIIRYQPGEPDPRSLDPKSPVKIGDRAVGPPVQWKPLGLASELDRYREMTQIPILKMFTSTIGITYDYLNDLADDCPELRLSMKRTVEKKVAVIEALALHGKLNPTFSIFDLKQHGWRDHIDTHLNIEIDPKKKEVIDKLFDNAARRLEAGAGPVATEPPK